MTARTLGSYARPVTIEDAIAEYLRTGDADPMHPEWSGANLFDRAQRAEDALTGALLSEVRSRAAGRGWGSSVEVPHDMKAYTRAKVEPMVRGLFARAEHDVILQLLERSTVLATDDTVEDVIRGCGWLSTGWKVANLYLASIGAEVLGDGEDVHVGMSEDLKAYVTPEYFERQEPFVDFLVHECAHVLHDCKLERIGLRSTRSRERLVELEFRERETFAYSCEAFATIAPCRSAAKRVELAQELVAREPYPPDAVDVEKVEEIVSEAAPKRNGWKHILARCAPATPPRYHVPRLQHTGNHRPAPRSRTGYREPQRGDCAHRSA